MSLIEKPEFEIFNYSSNIALNLSELLVDQYYVIFQNNRDDYITLLNNYEECYNCPIRPEPLTTVYPHSERLKLMSSKYSSRWWLLSDKEGFFWNIVPNVKEFGVYRLNIDKTCTLDTLVGPVDIYLPIITVLLIFLAACIPVLGLIYLYNKKFKSNHENESEIKKKRIQSLDTFRGISIILMILVNYGGGGYSFLEHAIWNGLTIADIVFPWFLWIMGVCIPISIKSALRRQERYILWHIIKRSVILFLLGLVVNGVSSIYYLRIFGVLQRFSLCYFVVACTCFVFLRKEFPETPGIFEDLIIMIPQWICAFIFLIVHCALTFSLPIEDCPVVGYLGPGGIQGDKDMLNFGQYVNCSGGAAGYIDRLILSPENMYHSKILFHIYGTELPIDPEGILGTFTSIFQVFLGVQTGIILLTYKNHMSRVVRWLIWGSITGLIGGSLCGFTQEEGVIPINKTLWSVSFVFVTTSFAFLMLSALYAVIDDKNWWTGKPFLFAGMNPIILYVGQALTYKRFPFQWGSLEPLEPMLHFQMLAQAVWGTMLWWLVAYWLYKIKFFLSI